MLFSTGVPAKEFGKKRGRKEDLRSEKDAVHGFRNLSIFKIVRKFEQLITELKTKFVHFVNKQFPINPFPFRCNIDN